MSDALPPLDDVEFDLSAPFDDLTPAQGHPGRLRADFTQAGDGELQALISLAWSAREHATAQLVAATEEALARLVRAHLPEAAVIVLREDTSHLPPHGHMHQVLDPDGRVLQDTHDHDHGDDAGHGPHWHDQEWAEAADEYAWDLHFLDPGGFVSNGTGQRVRVIPIEMRQ